MLKCYYGFLKVAPFCLRLNWLLFWLYWWFFLPWCRWTEQGYFQALFGCIERLLASLKVKHFVLPAADEAESIWTQRFGFVKITQDEVEKRFHRLSPWRARRVYQLGGCTDKFCVVHCSCVSTSRVGEQPCSREHQPCTSWSQNWMASSVNICIGMCRERWGRSLPPWYEAWWR